VQAASASIKSGIQGLIDTINSELPAPPPGP
jgi:hypothetical protein